MRPERKSGLEWDLKMDHEKPKRDKENSTQRKHKKMIAIQDPIKRGTLLNRDTNYSIEIWLFKGQFQSHRWRRIAGVSSMRKLVDNREIAN